MKSRDAKCIATHKRPDVDALVSVWLAECYLFSGHPVKIEFLEYGVDVEQLTGVDCAVDVGGVYCCKRHLFDHKPPAFADRHEHCAAGLLWQFLRRRDYPVEHLADLIRLVHDGDSAKRRAGSAAYARSRREGLHAAIADWKQSGVSDADLYRHTKSWLNRRFQDAG